MSASVPPLIGVAAALAAQSATPSHPPLPAIFQQFALADRVALITGANGGLGLETALAFLEAGARAVYCVDLPEQPSATWVAVNEYVASMKLGGRLEYGQGDVSNQQKIWDIANDIGDKEGRLDICVAGAAVVDKDGKLSTLDYRAEDYDKVLDVDLKGVLYTAQAAGRQMRRFGSPGSIILLASIFGLMSMQNFRIMGYYSSKGGVIQMARALAVELAPHKIRVNSIAPGFVSTAITTAAIGGSKEVEEKIKHLSPMERIAEPHEIRGPMVWLASDASSFSNGSNIEVSGGVTAW